jgi:hypothetical protein
MRSSCEIADSPKLAIVPFCYPFVPAYFDGLKTSQTIGYGFAEKIVYPVIRINTVLLQATLSIFKP